MQKKIVVIGGGNGGAISINALKVNADLFDISAVISMSDSGGSSGKLRAEFNTLPPGDIMRAVLAMSPYDYNILKKIFYKNRFNPASSADCAGQVSASSAGGSSLTGHNLGNLFLVWAKQYDGDFMAGIRALEQSVEAAGKVYPATLDQVDLVVELSNGEIIKTEAKIDRPEYDRDLRIVKAWLEPEAMAYEPAVEAIRQADYLVIGPGSFYTSVISALLPIGIKSAIEESKAKIIFVLSNAYEANGETGPEKASEFVNEIQNYLPRKIDLIIQNNHQPDEKDLIVYKDREWGVVTNDINGLDNYQIIAEDLENVGGGISPGKLGEVLKIILK